MGLISRVKCSKCDRQYSGLRLKCPYCGAPRSKRTVRKEQEEASRSKFLVGGIVLVVLIIAVVVLIITSLNSKAPTSNENDVQDLEFTQDDGVNSLTGDGDDDGDNGQPDDDGAVGTNTDDDNTTQPTDTAESKINSVSIVRNGVEQTDVTFYVGDTYAYSYETDPADSTETPVWSSDDEDVAVVLQNGEVTAVGSGTTFINVTVGGKTASMIIRVKS